VRRFSADRLAYYLRTALQELVGHWNVVGLAQNVLKMYMEYDLALYDKCTAAYFRDEEGGKKKLGS
jgi:hypothetical protein